MLSIAYVADSTVQKVKKITKAEKLRNDAIATVARAKIEDRKKAKEILKKLWDEVESLEAEAKEE